MQFKKLMDFSAAQWAGQRVFIRADFNVPQDDAGKNDSIAHHAKMQARGAAAPLPSDVICAKRFFADATPTHTAIKDVDADDLIVDLGTDSAVALARTLQTAGNIVWNDPVGVFEFDAFGSADQIDYISTAGGAFPEFLEGKTLPAIEVLKQRAGL